MCESPKTLIATVLDKNANKLLIMESNRLDNHSSGPVCFLTCI